VTATGDEVSLLQIFCTRASTLLAPCIWILLSKTRLLSFWFLALVFG
jgi:hypothetical protein